MSEQNNQDDPRAAGRHAMPQQPVVFMFQPTEYEVVPPERLSEWEDAMRERVGLQVNLGSERGMQCFSFCGDVVPDDSDWLAAAQV